MSPSYGDAAAAAATGDVPTKAGAAIASAASALPAVKTLLSGDKPLMSLPISLPCSSAVLSGVESTNIGLVAAQALTLG
jgi:hypothetical protein